VQAVVEPASWILCDTPAADAPGSSRHYAKRAGVALTSELNAAAATLRGTQTSREGAALTFSLAAGAVPLVGNVDIGAAAPTFRASDGTAVV
jgi:hypothetical protein